MRHARRKATHQHIMVTTSAIHNTKDAMFRRGHCTLNIELTHIA